jgi:hypothetical protein
MGKSPFSGRLSQEAEDIITLGELLKHQREEEQRRRVDAIVASSLTVGEKIREIRKLDAGAGQEPQEEEGQRTRPLRYRLPALADILKKPHSRLPYLSFLFGDYRRVVTFGKLTGVLERVYFLPDVRPGRAVPPFLNQELKQWAAELSGVISEGLEDSWGYLHKLEYNLLVVAGQLCEKILSINFSLFNYRDPYLINKLRSLEALFLLFHYQETYQAVLRSSLQQIGKNDTRVGEKYQRAVELIHKILDVHGSTPSLYNVILGLNMLKYRRYLTIGDLLCTDLGELINTRDFACPARVKERIRALVEAGRRRLEELRSELEKTNRVKAFLCLDDSGGVSFEPLRELYEGLWSEAEGYSFTADSEDMLAFLPRFFDGVDRTFGRLLNGQIEIEEVGVVTLFTHDFFQLEFLRLRKVAGRMAGYHEEKLSRSRFLDLQHSAKGIESGEAEILRQVNEGIEVLLETARRVETLLNTRRTGRGLPAPPLDPTVLHGKRFSVPYEKKRIVSSGTLHGRTVVEALTDFVGLCLTAAVFYHYLPIYTPLEQEAQHDKELRAQLEILNRLAGPQPLGG